jgi:diguanylate cyclase (GGDEF)-like protein
MSPGMSAPKTLVATLEKLFQTVQDEITCHPQRALSQAEEAIALADHSSITNKLKRQALLCRGMARRFCGDLEGSFKDYEDALEQAQEHADEEQQASANLGLGIVHRNRGSHRDALVHFRTGLELARRSGARSTESSLLNCLANVYSVLGSHSEAVSHYLEAIELARSEGDQRGELVMISNLGYLSEEIGALSQALSYYEQSLQLSVALGDLYFQAGTLSNQCSTLRQLGRLKESQIAGELACAQARQLENPIRLGSALQALATVYRDQGQLAQASTHMQEAIACYQEAGSLRYLPGALRLQGEILLRQDNTSAAEQSFQQALAQAQNDQDAKEEAATQKVLAQFYEDQGAHARALCHFKAYHQLEHRLEREHVQLVLASRLADVEAQKAQKEAELQRLRNGALAAVNAALEEANREKAALVERLAQQATQDHLTQLHNRRYLEQYLPGLPLGTLSSRRTVSLALADLDDFKDINDRFGHEIGDKVLRKVAKLFQKNCPRDGILVRYGGEEILLILPNTEQSVAHQLCEKIRLAIQHYSWSRFHPELRVTISIGLGSARTRSLRKLLKRADSLLYEAKSAGKNRIAS